MHSSPIDTVPRRHIRPAPSAVMLGCDPVSLVISQIAWERGYSSNALWAVAQLAAVASFRAVRRVKTLQISIYQGFLREQSLEQRRQS